MYPSTYPSIYPSIHLSSHHHRPIRLPERQQFPTPARPSIWKAHLQALLVLSSGGGFADLFPEGR